MNQAKIGAYLCRLRREKQLTQETLAEALGVSARTISRWETGSNLPDLSLLTVRANDHFPFVLLTDDSIAFMYATGAALRLALADCGETVSTVEKAHCQFILRGDDLDLDAITERLALDPRDARKSADFPQVKAGTGHAQDLWMIKTPDVDLSSMPDVMRTFGWLLTQKQACVQAVKRDFTCTSRIDLVLYLREFAFDVDRAWIRFAAETATTIGFDLY